MPTSEWGMVHDVNVSSSTPNQPNYHPPACTLGTCPLFYAYLLYNPSLAGNSIYLAIFSLLLPIQVLLYILYRTSGIFIAIFLGLSLEIIGYVGRIHMHFNPFLKEHFLTYLIPLTIGPVFLAAAIYLCLARIVVVYGEQFSLMRPRSYTLLFCCCDFVSLLLQAIGGAIAAMALTRPRIHLGTHIMVAGLAAQVASLLLFMVLCLEFAHRAYVHRHELNQKHAVLYNSKRFKLFLCSLSLATLTIFTRSVFRVAELSGGFGGHLANDEVPYMILEGAMIVIASSCLTVMHPGIGFGRQAWAEGDWHLLRKHEKSNHTGTETDRNENNGKETTVEVHAV